MTKLCPRGKAAAKRKFKVYPSAYANAYASKICAGKAKDDRGVRRKDFKGPKPSGGGGTGAAARRIRKASSGGDIKVKQIDPLAQRMSKTGFGLGGGKGKGKVRPIKTAVKNQSPVGKRRKRKMTTTEVARARAAQLPIGVKMEGKKYGLPPAPKKRFDSKGKDKFAQYKKLVLKKRDRKNPSRDFLPVPGQPTRREYHSQTYSSNYKKTKKPDDRFIEYKKGGKVKVYKAGKGMLLPLFGLAGMAKYMSMNKKKSGTVAPNKGVVDPVTGKGMDQTNTGNTNEKMLAAIKNAKVLGSKKGGMKVQKAGLGLMMLMNQMKKEGKKKGRRQAEEGMMQNKQYQDFLASQNKPNTTNMSMGGMVPTATGSYIKQDIDGDEGFTNPSAQEYYKDLLD